MSDFLAIAAVRGKVLHLVDFDRPVWMNAENPMGDRIIPDLDNMLTDALLFFCHEELGISEDIFDTKRGNERLFEMAKYAGTNLDKAREEVRSSTREFVLLAHFGILDTSLRNEIELLSTKVFTAPIDQGAD